MTHLHSCNQCHDFTRQMDDTSLRICLQNINAKLEQEIERIGELAESDAAEAADIAHRDLQTVRDAAEMVRLANPF